MRDKLLLQKKLIPCNVCGSNSFDDLYEDELGDTPPTLDYNFNEDTRKTFKIVRCQSCNLIFTNPIPIISSLYEETVDEIYMNSQGQRLHTARASLEMIKKYKKSGTLLDIGCSTGIFLDVAQNTFEVEGIELSKWAFDIASKNHKVYQNTLKDLNFKEKYDVITLWGVIEHFEDPKSEIKAIYKALAPGGVFIVYTGDVDAWLPKLLGKKWWWFQGMHLYYFSKKTLTKLLRDTGFDVIGNTNHKLYFQLSSLAVSLQRYKISKLFNPILKWPFIKNKEIVLKLSGEMVLIAKKH